ncbi:hypothetical protein B9Z55_011036 [Caenorhabditis nigoni]|uniref:Uncharacterized protein n=1 Tax=Caenorhabditis nigoni TaxID=1611254 RepID=A0A2G5UIC3_9PELO|nr:hypothetical protein B9Z55_011036 [Caenorhabditis nigoni]
MMMLSNKSQSAVCAFVPRIYRLPHKTDLHKTPACKSKECEDCSDISCPHFSSRQECPPKCRKGCKNQLSRAKPESVPFFISKTEDKGKSLFAKRITVY